MIMPIERIPDWDQRLARQDAFWQCEIIDRPVIVMTLPKAAPVQPWPVEKAYAEPRERWMDVERVVECAVAGALNTDCLGDALPTAWPNLGPEVFSAFFGMEMEYTQDTSWGIPNLTDWAQADALVFDEDNFYRRKLSELTDALLAAGKGLYYVGLSDLHAGGDGIAAFRDPQDLNIDMLTAPDDVKRLLARLGPVYFDILDHYFEKLQTAGQAITSWPGIVSSKRWYVPSNDFSCMLSAEMFDEFFLPGIAEECRHLEASIYHLDGPDALRHLDSLLAIDELNAIQWVYGEGNGAPLDWLSVYQRCQEAGKGIQLFSVAPDALDTLMANLRPEGVWMSVNAKDGNEAQAVLDKVETWT
ncbi:MAG: hypothetical protein GWP08_02935 [Nitrospiraceae bacterium]|nr:hypothetical protein [Nitrospiraceae bacterium]